METLRKPRGGYRVLPVAQICAAWTAYRAGQLTWLAFRTYLALHEVAARREAARRSAPDDRRERSYALHADAVSSELRLLVDCARPAQARAALRRLAELGLVTLRGDELRIANVVSLSCDARVMISRLGRTGGLPFPRPMLRSLARGASSATIAYAIGVVTRCCHVGRDGSYSARGRCSTRFVADAFGLHQRTIKRAAGELAGIGWISRNREPTSKTQQFGAPIAVNLAWSPACIKSPPHRPPLRTGMPPRTPLLKLLPDSLNQKPRQRGRGVCSSGASRPNALANVQVGELTDGVQLNVRFARAVTAGLIVAGPASKLRFFAAAVHARRVGRRNPCGLFVSVVRRGLWSFISQGDEDTARAMLARSEQSATQRQCCSPDLERVRSIVTSVASCVAWPASQVSRNCRKTADTRSKHRAAQRSSNSSASTRMAFSASRTTATFSTNVARNAARSPGPGDVRGGVSIASPCHNLPPFGKSELQPTGTACRSGLPGPVPHASRSQASHASGDAEDSVCQTDRRFALPV